MAFTHSSKSNPCPVCGRTKDGDCRWPNADFVLCHTHTGEVETVAGWINCGPAKDPMWSCWRRQGTTYEGDFSRKRNSDRQRRMDNQTVHGVGLPEPKPTRNWGEWIAENPCNQEHLEILAEILGARIDGVRRLRPAFFPEDGEGPTRWAWPCRNGKYQTIGAQYRYGEPLKSGPYRGHSKLNVKGGFSGLYYDPLGWYDPRKGPVLLVEGASDTATLLGLGLNAVGRPSCTGGVDSLVELLRERDPGEEVVVVGENDEHDNSKGVRIWPGRDGAKRTAETLADRLPHLVIYWGLCPDGMKDSREWASKYDTGGPAADVGKQFLAGLCANLTVCTCRTDAPWPGDEVAAPAVRGGSPETSYSSDIREKDLSGHDTAEDPAEDTAKDKEVRIHWHEQELSDALICPPKSACPRRTTAILQNRGNENLHRAGCTSCSCWHCTVCAQIKAVRAIKHVGTKVEEAFAHDLEVRAIDVTEEDRAKVRESLRKAAYRQEEICEYAELQRPSGGYLFLIAAASTLALPSRVSHAATLNGPAVARLLRDWAVDVRKLGYEKLPDKKRLRPINLSSGWGFPQEPPEGNWKIIGGTPAVEKNTVLRVLMRCGVPQVLPPPASDGEDKRQWVSPYVWHVEFLVTDSAQQQRVLEELSIAQDDVDPQSSRGSPFHN